MTTKVQIQLEIAERKGILFWDVEMTDCKLAQFWLLLSHFLEIQISLWCI
jgi:hypothetical protein